MNNKITIIDHRTGMSYDLPVVQGAINALELRQAKASDDDVGLMTYDPGFKNTASCRSRITLSTANEAFCNTEVTPLSNWPRAAVIWKRRIC